MDIKTKNKRISSLEKDIKFKTIKLEELMVIQFKKLFCHYTFYFLIEIYYIFKILIHFQATNSDLNKRLEGKPTDDHQTQIIEALKAELNSEKLKISDLTVILYLHTKMQYNRHLIIQYNFSQRVQI